MRDDAPSDALADISGRLRDLTDEKLLKILTHLAEIPTSSVVPALLDEVRPRLRELRPMRPLSLLRLLCGPFEDLLSDAAPALADRIPRSAIEPCWRLLVERDGRGYRRFKAELEDMSPSAPVRVAALAEKLWRWAASVYSQVVAEQGGPPHLALIRDALEAGTAIEAFKRAVPGLPVAELGTFEAPHVEAGLRQLAAQGLAADAYLMAVAARLANPGELLAFRHFPGVTISEVSLSRLTEFAIVEIEERGGDFTRDLAAAIPNDIARAADRLMQSFAVARDALDEGRRAQLDERMAPVITSVRAALRERVIDQAPAIIAAALPPSGTVPATSAIVEAEGHARALGRSRRAAALVGLETQVAATIADVRQRFETNIADRLREASAGPGADPDAVPAIYRGIRFVELIDGPQRARELLFDVRRRLKPRLPAAPVTEG